MTNSKPSSETPGPRERIVYAAVQQLRQHGVEGMGLRPLVAAADAPWGSLRHYFPGGKEQIVAEALAWSGNFAATVVQDYFDAAAKPTSAGLVTAVLGWYANDLQARDFSRGCPVAAAIADGSDARQRICGAADVAFETWLTPIRDGLIRLRHEPDVAADLAVLLVAALEGAILMARAKRSVEPLRAVERRLCMAFAAVEAK